MVVIDQLALFWFAPMRRNRMAVALFRCETSWIRRFAAVGGIALGLFAFGYLVATGFAPREAPPPIVEPREPEVVWTPSARIADIFAQFPPEPLPPKQVRTVALLGKQREPEPEPPRAVEPVAQKARAQVIDVPSQPAPPTDICVRYKLHRIDYIRDGHRYWHCVSK
jgi:hypothetical protein